MSFVLEHRPPIAFSPSEEGVQASRGFRLRDRSRGGKHAKLRDLPPGFPLPAVFTRELLTGRAATFSNLSMFPVLPESNLLSGAGRLPKRAKS
eukprot:16427508-Heterocapsa_arctica.AAC.2